MKAFCINYIKVHMCNLLPNTLSYYRFVERMAGGNLPLGVFVKI
jgi:hypothetical protein